jgi:ferritin-like metal-binding protein YciE
MQLDTLRKLYIHQLQDLYSAEKQITRALPKLIRAATSDELRAALADHLRVTEDQIGRLEKIFRNLGASSRGKKCKGMEGLIEEGAELLEEEADPEVLDAGIIAAAQRVEHYEISGYGTARAYAELLGEADAALLLDRSADEEGAADKTLTRIAQSAVNLSAATGGLGEPTEPRRRSGSRRRQAARRKASAARASRKKK